jgi:3-dehydroquinate synthase
MNEGDESHIVFGGLDGLFSDIEASKTVIVTDPEIRRFHGATFPPCPVIELARGEAGKTLASVEGLYASFLELGVEREHTVLAIGGGSVSDAAGFAASTWLRGVDFGFAPTTLLSMVDASVGGKNGVDYRGYKNLIGSFTKPRFIRFDLSLLSTLPDADFASGMAEAVKHALIEGEERLAFLETCCASRASLAAESLLSLVESSVAFKSGVTRRDGRERGERRKLNLGHTIGHAIEARMGLSHGEAVAAGLCAALELAVRRYGADAALLERVAAFFRGWGLPSSIDAAAALATARGRALPGGAPLRAELAALIRADKKRSGGDILFLLPYAVGEVRILPIPLEALEGFVEEAS